MERPDQPESRNLYKFFILFLIVGIILGSTLSYVLFFKQIDDLQNEISDLKDQFQGLPTNNITYIFNENTSLSELYEDVNDGIVIVRGIIVSDWDPSSYALVQGSGFVYNYSGNMFIITNYHVVQDATNITITFINGNGYAATVLGSDPYVDLAVLSSNAPQYEYIPLEVISSTTLKVGHPIIAIGNPYGLSGSMSTGIVSALGRTINSEMTGNFPIANVVQITAPINPGNSGGPLLNYQGQVVGITTAIVAASQGIGFAIPSSTILREIEYLITTGEYNQHSWLGVSGIDMNYDISEELNLSITYGWLVVQVVNGGPADRSGLRVNDIIIALDGQIIRNGDDLAAYFEENTQPGEIISVTVVRNNLIQIINVELGTRPSLPG